MSLDGPRRLWRELTGRANADFVDSLAAQLDACLDGARLAHRLARGDISPADARKAMIVIEHTGDARRAELIEALALAIVTPIDREDLFRVSRAIDDVLDNLRDYVREVDLLGAPAWDEPFVALTASVIEAVEHLDIAVSNVVDDPTRVSESVIVAKRCGNDIRQLYEMALVDLLGDDTEHPEESTRAILRTRELLRRLDVVGLRLGQASDALSDAMMKRSY